MKVKLTESKLKQIVNESVRRVLREFDWDGNREAHYASLEYNNPASPHYSPLEGNCRVSIWRPLFKFVVGRFDENVSDDFIDFFEQNYDMTNPYCTVYENHIEEITNYDEIINYIKTYHDSEVSKIIVDAFDDIVYDYSYDEYDDYEWDEYPDGDY